MVEPWKEASVEIKTDRSGARTVASGKGQAGAWNQGKKKQLQRTKSPHEKKEALGVGGAIEDAFTMWLSCATLHGGKSMFVRRQNVRKWRVKGKSSRLHLC